MRSSLFFAFASLLIALPLGPAIAEGGAADELAIDASDPAPLAQALTSLATPNEAWAAAVDGSTNAVEWIWKDQEAVYGFTGGRAASFDSFSVYVYETGSNPRSFEISVGDEGVQGRFTSIGTCDIANMKLETTPFQICKFPRVTAHFIKVKLLDTHDPDGAAYVTEFRVNAALAGTETAIATREGSSINGAINLFNRSSMRVAPNNAWMATVDGDNGEVPGMLPEQEAIYGFANGQAAKFDTFAVAINGAAPDNPRTFELLIADDPAGSFETIARCHFANMKILQAPFQECHFAPATAKYLKVKYTASQGSSDGRAHATEFRLFGKILPGSGSPVIAPAAEGAAPAFTPFDTHP